MGGQDTRTVVIEELGNVAPEADLTALDPMADLCRVLDIDSLDFPNFVTAVHTRLGRECSREGRYARLITLDGAVQYLERARQRAR